MGVCIDMVDNNHQVCYDTQVGYSNQQKIKQKEVRACIE